jgi:hypothetical protein
MPSNKRVIAVRPDRDLYQRIVRAAAESSRTPGQFLLYHARKALAEVPPGTHRRAMAIALRQAEPEEEEDGEIDDDPNGWYAWKKTFDYEDATPEERESLDAFNGLNAMTREPLMNVAQLREHNARNAAAKAAKKN